MKPGMNLCHRLFFALLAGSACRVSAAPAPPNVVFILADDLGYGDLGCYGQERIRTPNIDRLAAEGMRFSQCYAGSTVCAPSRCALLTGKHTGHATIRGNSGKPEVPLSADDLTVPQVFHQAGYATALIGKWGVGENGTTGAPNRKGVDYFLGYLTQVAAHNYYPPFIWRNTEKFPLPDNASGQCGCYTHDLFMREALDYIRAHRGEPFFLELPVTIPHANNEERPNGMQVPDDAPYSHESWPSPEKNFAAMITRLDASVGQIVALLRELSLDENTLLIFTSDNGAHSEGGHSAGFFHSSGPLRGIKRDLHEGGIRVPLIVRWPGHVPSGVVSTQIVAFWDFLPTFAALTGQSTPPGLDGVSVLPAWLSKITQPHPPLYFEFYESGFSRAVRSGDWKGVSRSLESPMELFDLAQDISETQDLAAAHPDVVRDLENVMRQQHLPSAVWSAPKKRRSTQSNPLQ